MNPNNNKYFNTRDENFDAAFKLVSQDLTTIQLFEMLKNGNIPEKQIAALKVTSVDSSTQAKILLDNLTGQDGKIREAVSMKINELTANPQFIHYFENLNAYDTFLEAIIDINANICRNIITTVSRLKQNPKFSKYFTRKLLEKIHELIDIVKTLNLQDGKYKINKEVFKLYWCLETLFEFATIIKPDELKSVLFETANINDYTIREKTAKILTLNFTEPELESLKQKLKKDPNYYVRRY